MSSNIINEIIQEAEALAPEIIQWRRKIHQHPELSFKEIETSAFVREKLGSWGIEPVKILAKTGVTALIKGKKPGKTVLLRADMDALPIQEETGLDFASKIPGQMHACGHDSHTAMLLGTAKILSSHRDSFSGNVKLMFQPAEELGGGGRHMVAEGILEDPKVDGAFAMHVSSDCETGTVAVTPGFSSAASDRFVLTIHGKSVHSTKPHKGSDAILIAAQIICALNTVVGRNVDPMEPSNLSVGIIHGGTAPNIIADKVEVTGSIRSFSKENRDRLIASIQSISTGMADSLGGSCDVEIFEGYPSVYNDAKTTTLFRETAAEVLDASKGHVPVVIPESTPVEERIIIREKPMMGSEDFAFVLRDVPGTLFYLGTKGNQPHNDASPHNCLFTIDDSVLGLGTMLMASSALRFLES